MQSEHEHSTGAESSEERFVTMSPESLQEQAFQYTQHSNDIEILQIERILINQLEGLDEDDPNYTATLQAQTYVSDLINTSLERIQNDITTHKS